MKKYYTGRKKIIIPITFKEFYEDPTKYIKAFISKCLTINKENVAEYMELNQVYTGMQDIFNKVRLDGSSENNNQVVVNHTFRQVEFKKGFMVGNPIEYSQANSIKDINNDLSYLNKYLRDSNKASKDIDKYEDLYIAGVANQFIIPKTENFNAEDEAPFELMNIDFGNGFVVFSGDAACKPLFNVLITEKANVDASDRVKKEIVYDIFYIKQSDEGYCYNFVMKRINNRYEILDNKEEKQPYKYLPLVEYALNKSRMGIVELVLAIQNCLNAVQSNQLDDIVEFVNAYLVYENQDIDKKFKETFDEFKKKRVLAIKSTNPQLPAKVSLLKQSLNHTDINSFFELLKSEMYDIVACPQASGNVTSGGDTGAARLLGNGWETAQNQAQVDTTYIKQFEYELLKKIIITCKIFKTPIKKIAASDIEIKYSINMSNNLLVKTQSLKYLYDMNMPKQEALTMTGLTSDSYGIGNKWEENDNRIKELQNQESNNNGISN